MIESSSGHSSSCFQAIGDAVLAIAFTGLIFACTGPAPPPGAAQEPVSWVPLLEGEALSAWRETEFGGGGEVRLEEARAWFDFGSPLTGMTWQGPFPRDDYELELEATRLDGNDFFCGLTFPVGDGECTLILGGWGGALTGLSCIDGEDASQNETTSFRHYAQGEPVAVRVRVDREAIRVWLEEEPIINQLRAGHSFSLRPEVQLSSPLGIAAFCTRAEVGNLRYRELVPSG